MKVHIISLFLLTGYSLNGMEKEEKKSMSFIELATQEKSKPTQKSKSFDNLPLKFPSNFPIAKNLKTPFREAGPKGSPKETSRSKKGNSMETGSDISQSPISKGVFCESVFLPVKPNGESPPVIIRSRFEHENSDNDERKQLKKKLELYAFVANKIKNNSNQ